MNQIQRSCSNLKKDFQSASTIIWTDNGNDKENTIWKYKFENTSLKKDMTSAIKEKLPIHASQ